MKCDGCGREVAGGSAFCPHCGAQLAGDAGDSGNSGRATGAARFTQAGRGAADQPAEDELWSGSYSPKAMIGWVIGAALLTIAGAVAASISAPPGWIVFAIAALVVWAALGLVVLYRRWTVHYQLTTYRLFHETGLLSRTRERIEVIDIDDVTLTQGLVERMFNVGTIYILSSDVSLPNGKLVMPGIEEVRRVTDLIDNTRRAERQRRGIFMENV